MSSTNSDEALYFDAKKKIDNLDWTGAITIITTQMSTSYQQRVDVRQTLAGAYAGRCGLNIITLINNLSSSGSGTLFNFFMAAMENTVVTPADCDTAQTVMESFGTNAQRTSDQNLYMTLLGMAKSGAYLRKKADQDNGGLGNGSEDAGFDVCNAAQLTNADVTGAIVGLGLLINNFSAVSSLLGASTVTLVNNFNTTCQAMNGGTACDLTDTTFISAHMTEFRSMLNDTTMGIGSCSTDTMFTACPCDGM
jgi:hypothetical protein